ncbi:5'-nucleotidase domain-containing protein 2-like [Halichondria panicea]|uniref:5'-nucleotidase domain-containing protein 2-like n=1 Tax=Halichondria panicea TaxID=6063 RepID=UPI00312B4419
MIMLVSLRCLMNVLQRRCLHTWPNIRPVTSALELASGALINGPNPPTSAQLIHLLESKATQVFEELRDHAINGQAVFTNSELSLKYIDVYGFDFDYTLVHYKQSVLRLIYGLAKNRLVEQLNYPTCIRELSFDPSFAIRGLHCDIKRGYVMKVDAYNHIQLTSVYRGHEPVSTEEVVAAYGGTHVPMTVMDSLSRSSTWKLTQFLDLFSIPETALFADLMQYMIDHGISFDPEYLFEDVQNTVYNIHQSGEIHRIIARDPDTYLESQPVLRELLNRLQCSGKKLFIITNSPFWFVDKGMSHLLGSSDWRDLFDVVVTNARKPSFYSDSHRPFRTLNSDLTSPSWQPITQLTKGGVYLQGNVSDFMSFTGWNGASVLYFGDHVFSDLADPILQLGWKTGAILPELEREIETSNSTTFKSQLADLLSLESLLQRRQNYCDADIEKLLESWKVKRDIKRKYLKEAHNVRFGSVFRTEKNPTYFSRRLATFSNLYTSSLNNLMNYSLDYTFIPRRAALPHEPDLNFDF